VKNGRVTPQWPSSLSPDLALLLNSDSTVPLKIVVPLLLVMTFTAALTADVHAQTNQPPLPALTRGATHETRTVAVPGLTAATSACPVSDDPTYGVTPGNPIKVGGGALYVMSRSMRFLQALRGSTGQGLHLWRLGSFDGPDETMLDVYQVEHDGAVQHLYVDGYRWAELKAPRAWSAHPWRSTRPGRIHWRRGSS
jgi:hypothetical protein